MNKNLATTGYILATIWIGLGGMLLAWLDDSVSKGLVFVGILFLAYAWLVWFGERNGRFHFLPRATEQHHLRNLLLTSTYLAIAYGLRLWLTDQATVFWFLYTLGVPIIIAIILFLNRSSPKE